LTTKSRILITLITITVITTVLVATWVTPKLMRRFYLHGLELVEVASGLGVPWAMAFMPDGSILITERAGQLRLIDTSGSVGAPISGLPPIAVGGEGGLMGVVLDPNFSASRYVYWSYSEPAPDENEGVSTAVARGRLSVDTTQLTDVEVIYRQSEKLTDQRHFGGRLLFDDQERLLVGLGDRMNRADAQDLGSAHGKLLRLLPDGGIPEENPFANEADALDEILSYGHRNIQGMAINPQTKSLWATEHGPDSGDEVNLITAGANYGWPLFSHGCEYTTCEPIGQSVEPEGTEAPLTYFAPESVPPSALSFVTSERYPDWQGHVLMGVLHSRALMLMKVDGDEIVSRKPLWLGKYMRVRDVQQGPDGWIYVAVQSPSGTILKLMP